MCDEYGSGRYRLLRLPFALGALPPPLFAGTALALGADRDAFVGDAARRAVADGGAAGAMSMAMEPPREDDDDDAEAEADAAVAVAARCLRDVEVAKT